MLALIRSLLTYPAAALAFVWRKLLRPLAPRRLLLAIEPPPLPPKKKTGPTELLLVRHGQSIWNEASLFTGWSDVELTTLGKNEAAEGATQIWKSGLKIDVAFTSLLKRAQQTLGAAMMSNAGSAVLNPLKFARKHREEKARYEKETMASSLAKKEAEKELTEMEEKANFERAKQEALRKEEQRKQFFSTKDIYEPR